MPDWVRPAPIGEAVSTGVAALATCLAIDALHLIPLLERLSPDNERFTDASKRLLDAFGFSATDWVCTHVAENPNEALPAGLPVPPEGMRLALVPLEEPREPGATTQRVVK